MASVIVDAMFLSKGAYKAANTMSLFLSKPVIYTASPKESKGERDVVKVVQIFETPAYVP